MRILKYFATGLAATLTLLLVLAAFYLVPIWNRLPSSTDLQTLSASVKIRIDTLPDHVPFAILAAEAPWYISGEPSSFLCFIQTLKHIYIKTRSAPYCTGVIPRMAFGELLHKPSSLSMNDWRVFQLLLFIKADTSLRKTQILELAINNVYFGRESHGITQAAHSYFGTTPAKLTLAQAAFLAGVIKAPAYYSSEADMARALKRRNSVLQNMSQYKFIPDEDTIAAMAESITLSNTPSHPPPALSVSE